MTIKTSLFGGRTVLGHDEDGEHVAGWAAMFSESARAMCHLTRGAIPAPEAYALLGELGVGVHRLTQVAEQLGAGLTQSLDEYDVVDAKRDPAESAAEATQLLALVVSLTRQAGDALDAAQVAINEQGHHGPLRPPE